MCATGVAVAPSHYKLTTTYTGVNKMPRGKGKSRPVEKPNIHAGQRYWTESDAVWGGYLDLRLNDDDRDKFDLWFGDNDTAWAGMLSDVLTEGMSFSMKFDIENSCFIASFIGAGVTGSNERYCLSARAGSWTDAAAMLVYKHSVLMGGVWDDFKPSNSRLKSWG